MDTKLILVDTNIIIEVFRNNQNIIQTINSIGIERTAISCVTAMELYYGALNKGDLRQIKKYIVAFENILIDHEISRIAMDLIEKYAKSHNLNLPDALIAATSLKYELELFTLNLKDFRYIPDLTIYTS